MATVSYEGPKFTDNQRPATTDMKLEVVIIPVSDVDRAKDFLKCRGEKVSCRQIEEVLLDFDELVEAAVIGIPDEVLGEAVKAFVVPRSRDSEGLAERVATFCKNRLAPHHLPKQIVVLSALPKSSAGKVLKGALRDI